MTQGGTDPQRPAAGRHAGRDRAPGRKEPMLMCHLAGAAQESVAKVLAAVATPNN